MNETKIQSRGRAAGRVLAAFAAAVLLVAAMMLAGCGQQEEAAEEVEAAVASEPVEVSVASLKGPTSIGLVDFMDRAEQGETQNTYDFQICGTADEILPNLIQGNIDIALIPANAASVVYNKTEGGVSVLDVNTLGVLYVVTADESLASIEDLAGKTVYMTGKGTTPEYAMNYLLDAAGIADDVTLEFKSEATEVAALLTEDSSAIAVLPEPYVTSVCAKNDALAARISLTDEWAKAAGAQGEASQMVTAVTVVRNDFLTEHPEAVEEFLQQQRASVEAVNADPAAAGELVVKAGIMDNAQAAAKAIPNCNVVCLTGSEMKEALSGYLQVLFDQDPSSVGGALPADAFYVID